MTQQLRETETQAEGLVDRLAAIRAEIKTLSDEESDIRGALLALKQNIIEGEQYTAILKLAPSTRLDAKAVKQEMGESWYKAHSTTTDSLRIETIAKSSTPQAGLRRAA